MALVRSPMEPSRRFGPFRSLSLWRGAEFDIARASLLSLFGPVTSLSWMVKEILRRDLGKEVSYTELGQRSCTESSYRDLVAKILTRDLL